MIDFAPMLEGIMAAFGEPVLYRCGAFSKPMTGAIIRMAIAPEDGAEGSGALVPFRSVLRVRISDFRSGDYPQPSSDPQQGAIIILSPNGPLLERKRYQITDVLTDRRGWFDLPLTEA